MNEDEESIEMIVFDDAVLESGIPFKIEKKNLSNMRRAKTYSSKIFFDLKRLICVTETKNREKI